MFTVAIRTLIRSSIPKNGFADANRFGIRQLGVRHLSRRSYDFTISNAAIKALPTLRFPGKILTVDANTQDDVIERALLNNSNELLGFGCENKGDERGNESMVMSYHLASKDVVVVWDPTRFHTMPKAFVNILFNPRITKVAYDIESELKYLYDQHHVDAQGFLGIYQFALHLKCEPKSLEALSAIFLKQKLYNDSGMLDPTSNGSPVSSWVTREVLLSMRKLYNGMVMPFEKAMGVHDLLDVWTASKNTALEDVGNGSSTVGDSRIDEKVHSVQVSAKAEEIGQSKRHSSLASLVALCVQNEYLLLVDGFTGDYENFKTSFRIIANGETHRVTSRESHRTLRSAQDDAAQRGLEVLAEK